MGHFTREIQVAQECLGRCPVPLGIENNTVQCRASPVPGRGGGWGSGIGDGNLLQQTWLASCVRTVLQEASETRDILIMSELEGLRSEIYTKETIG